MKAPFSSHQQSLQEVEMLVTVLSESYRTATRSEQPGVSHPPSPLSSTPRAGGWRHHKRPGPVGRAAEASLGVAVLALAILSLWG
jgi:hypothetical protein